MRKLLFCLLYELVIVANDQLYLCVVRHELIWELVWSESTKKGHHCRSLAGTEVHDERVRCDVVSHKWWTLLAQGIKLIDETLNGMYFHPSLAQPMGLMNLNGDVILAYKHLSTSASHPSTNGEHLASIQEENETLAFASLHV